MEEGGRLLNQSTQLVAVSWRVETRGAGVNGGLILIHSAV